MNIIIKGGGGHGRVIIDIVEKSEQFNLLGVLDANLPHGTNVLGYEVLGNVRDLNRLTLEREVQGVVISVGDNWLRSKMASTILAAVPNIAFPNVIHPSAQIGKSVRLGHGNVVMAGAVINSGATIGNFCILNTNCSVDHDVILGDYVSFAPNSCAGGSVEVGDYAAVCLGSNIIDRIRIGAHTVIGAGSTVVNDMPANIVAFGTPARKIRDRDAGDRYL
jgi:sugar O-acyltransferase (sialic acid O-acetyltransferase NeuD family)